MKLKNCEEISPKDVELGTELLHNPLLEKVEQKKGCEILSKIKN